MFNATLVELVSGLYNAQEAQVLVVLIQILQGFALYVGAMSALVAVGAVLSFNMDLAGFAGKFVIGAVVAYFWLQEVVVKPIPTILSTVFAVAFFAFIWFSLNQTARQAERERAQRYQGYQSREYPSRRW